MQAKQVILVVRLPHDTLLKVFHSELILAFLHVSLASSVVRLYKVFVASQRLVCISYDGVMIAEL